MGGCVCVQKEGEYVKSKRIKSSSLLSSRKKCWEDRNRERVGQKGDILLHPSG